MEDETTGRQLIHSYDVAQRRVLCGWGEQTRSTKRARSVTCPACLRLLVGAGADQLGATDPTR